MNSQFLNRLGGQFLSRMFGSQPDPLAAYTWDGGTPPDFVSDSINDFYYTSTLGVIDKATMYPDDDGIIADAAKPVTTNGLTIIGQGLMTYAQDAGALHLLDINQGGSRTVGIGLQSDNGTRNRAFARFNFPDGSCSCYEAGNGTEEPGTEVPYFIGATLDYDEGILSTEGVTRITSAGSAPSFPDLSSGIWNNEHSAAYDPDKKILIMWGGIIPEAALNELTTPFDLAVSENTLRTTDGDYLRTTDDDLLVGAG